MPPLDKAPTPLSVRLTALDRRWIYLFVGVVITASFFVPWVPKITVRANVQAMKDMVAEVAAQNKPLLVSFDYDPSVKFELEPMARALLRDALGQGVPVVGLTLNPNGQGMIEAAFRAMETEFSAAGKPLHRGRDFVNLGYKTGSQAVILGLGQDFRRTFPKDAYGASTAELPATKNIAKLADFGYIVSITGSATWEYWMLFGHERYKVPYGACVTGVMAPDIFPFIASKQVRGMVGGLAGAAEYETAIGNPGIASKSMTAQSAGHLLIVMFILLANALYLYDRFKPRPRPVG